MYSLRRFIFEHVLCLNWERNILIQSKDLRVCEVWLSLFRKGRHAWLSRVRMGECTREHSTHPPFGPPSRTSCGTTDVQSSIPPTNFAHTLNHEPCTAHGTRTHESNQSSVIKTGPQKDVPALTASFCACTAIWLFPAISPASAMASRTTTPSPSATTRLAIPHSAASCAFHIRPVSVSSIARDLPTALASRCEPPPPVIVPRLTSGWPNCALGATRSMSAIRASSQPPPSYSEGRGGEMITLHMSARKD
jgi:hypothetical protein